MRQQIKHRISILVGLALIGLSVNGYAAEVSADKTPTTAASSESNGASEIHTINVTANRMALLDLDTPAAMDVITQKDLANSGAKMHLMRLIWCPALRLFPMVHLVLNMGLWIAV